MSSWGGSDTSGLQPASSAVRSVCDVIIDANASGDQTLLVLKSPLIIDRIVYISQSGTVTIGVVKLGYNTGTTNDVVTAQALTSVATVGTALAGVPNNGYKIGVAAQTLSANMSTLAGTAGTLRIVVFGMGG